jgi:hypothetical protein
MTQISLILFNKLPFVCNDTGSLSESGACPGNEGARPGSSSSSKVYVRAYFGCPFESRADRSGAASAGIAAVLSCRS